MFAVPRTASVPKIFLFGAVIRDNSQTFGAKHVPRTRFAPKRFASKLAYPSSSLRRNDDLDLGRRCPGVNNAQRRTYLNFLSQMRRFNACEINHHAEIFALQAP